MRHFLSALKARRPPRLPEGVRVYAIGDVHGRADLLVQLLEQIDSHLAQNPVSRPIEVFLGDYVDRGPNSRDVIDLLIKRRNSRETIFLKGNHEKYLLDFLRDPKIWDVWRQYGGFETLLSYGLKPQTNPSPADRKELARTFADLLPRDHVLFLSCLISSFTCGDFFFVHAGVKPGVPLDQQAEKNLLWIRDDFLLSEDSFEKYVVHGHTPIQQPDIRSNRANIDTGAFVTGCLTCLVIEGQDMQVIAQSRDGAGLVADASQTKATVPVAFVLGTPEMLDRSESSPSIVPRHAIETVGNSREPYRTQSSSAAVRDVPEASSVVEQHFQGLHPTHPQAGHDRSLTAPSGRRRLRIVASSMVALLLLTAAPLLVPIVAAYWPIGANIGDAVPSSNPARAGLADHNARLILVHSADRSVRYGAPLGISVSGDTAGMDVVLGGLPTGMILSSGRPIGSGSWRIPASDVANALILAPQGIADVTDLVVELRLADDSVIDHGPLHLKWPSSPVVASRSERTAVESAVSSAATTKTAATPTPTQRDATLRAPASQLDRKRRDVLLSRSEKLISEGDVIAARILLQRAAAARDSRAAFTLGSTYDPIMLTILKVRGVTGDMAVAYRWYQKARDLGSVEAQRRLEALARVPMLQDITDLKEQPVTPSRARSRASAQDARSGNQTALRHRHKAGSHSGRSWRISRRIDSATRRIR
jgi:serine/threonine protein phosphatase 1